MSYSIWLEETPPSWTHGDPAATALATFAWLTPTAVSYPRMSSPEFPETREVEEVGNYTSNVSGMWHKALGCPLSELKNRVAGSQVELLAAGVASMEANAGEHRSNNPPNGWGDYEGAHDYLLGLLVACLRHPDAIIRISH